MKSIKLFTLFIIMILILTGCKMGKNQATKFEKKEKAPESLGKLSDSLQDILKETETIESILDGTDEEVKKAELEKVKEEEKAKQGNSMGEKKEGGSSSSEGGSSQSSNQDTESHKKDEKKPKDKEEKLLATWENLNKKIEETHKSWNDYESEGLKKGINQNSTQKFKDSINALTKSVEEKNILGIYDYTSQSMVNLAPILEVYKDEIWGEINRVKSAVYKSYAKAIVDKYEEAKEQLKDLEEVTNKTRLKIEDDDKKKQSLEKVNLSIEAMRQSLEEKSISLTRIKKDIIIKNLDELGK